MPTYNSPVNFNFTAGGYSATLPLEFVFSAFGEAKTRAVEGFEPLEFGLGLIRNNAEAYQLEGFDALEFGLQAIAIREPDIFGIGIGPSQWGFASVSEVVDVELPVPGIAGALGEPIITRTVVFTFGRTGYAPTYPLSFDFSVSETLQAAYTLGIDFASFGDHSIALSSLQVIADGFDDLLVPEPSVAGSFQQVDNIGIAELMFGAAVVRSGQLFVEPVGINAATYGTAIVSNSVPQVFPVGFDASAFGAHSIANFQSRIFPLWTMDDLYGLALVAFEIRSVSPVGFDDGGYGSAEVTNYIQNVDVPGLPSMEIGGHAVSFEIEIAAFGFDALSFGLAAVVDNTIYVSPPGISGASGLGEVFRAQEIVFVDGISPADDFGDTAAFNLVQEIEVTWDPEFVAGPVSSPAVSNYTIDIFPLGFDALRVPDFSDVINGRPPLEVTLGVQTEFGFLFVAQSTRDVAAEGLDAYKTGEAFVLNAAQSFTPEGFESGQFGEPDSVFNGLQFSAEITAGLTQEFGMAFVAPRIRQVFPGGIFNPGAGDTYVGNYTQYFAPPGIPSFADGLAFVETRLLRIEQTNQEDYLAVGLPRVENRNVATRPLPWDDATIGVPDIQLRTRILQPAGFFDEISGVHIVGDREIFIRPIAISGAVGSHWVRPFPIPPDRIDVSVGGFEASDFGLALVVANSLFPDGWDSLQMGTARAAGSGIFPVGIFEDFTADTRPSVDATLYIFLGPTEEREWPSNGIAPPLWETPNVPRVSPHTIWAPTGAPAQAKDNHPPGDEEPIHILGDQQKRNTLYGTPFISHLVRFVAPSWNWPPFASGPSDDAATRWGDHFVGQSFTQYIEPRWRVGRIGIHEVFGGDRTIVLQGFDDLLTGDHFIDILPEPASTKTVAPAGIASSFGEAWVSNYVREITVGNIDVLTFGMQWVNRPYPPFEMIGIFDGDVGAPWVSNYRREIFMLGSDLVLMQEEIPFDRMRVSGRTIPMPLGFVATEFGSPLIDQSSRSIQAFSLFRLPFPVPAVSSQTAALVDGFDALTLGLSVVDQTELNSLKAKGEDSAVIGSAILRAAIAAAPLAGEMGEPRIGSPIYVSSMAGVVERPVITGDDEHTCGMAARAIAGAGLDMGEFGVATIG
ncbi:MAG: hypothetical protein ACRC2H_05620 [Silanimonas sp.]